MAAELQKLNESGPVLPKDGAGQRMERSMELKKEAHDKLNVAEKAAVRKSWVESQTANSWETQAFTQSWREVSVEIGEYLFGEQDHPRGGWEPEDVEACMKLVMKASQMGYARILWNEATERL